MKRRTLKTYRNFAIFQRDRKKYERERERERKVQYSFWFNAATISVLISHELHQTSRSFSTAPRFFVYFIGIQWLAAIKVRLAIAFSTHFRFVLVIPPRSSIGLPCLFAAFLLSQGWKFIIQFSRAAVVFRVINRGNVDRAQIWRYFGVAKKRAGGSESESNRCCNDDKFTSLILLAKPNWPAFVVARCHRQ